LDAIGLDRAAEQLAGSEQVGLAGVFVERTGPHPGRQWRGLRGRGRSDVSGRFRVGRRGEQVIP